MELLGHIKELLLQNDCVIIPGFGGFVSNYKSAENRSARFTPPTKTVNFNKKLNFNDGLFINHVSLKDGIGYIASKKKVELLVQELNYRLTDGEEIEIAGIGTLQYDAHENLIFKPKVEGNLSLDSFGLPSFSYETLFQKKHAAQLESKSIDVSDVVFSQRKLKKVLIAVPLLLALAVIPLKNNKINLQKSDLSTLTEMMTVKEPVVAPVVEETLVVENVEMDIQEVELNYFMIGGSFKSASNANNFVSQMTEKGYDADDIGVINGLHYIALNRFATIEEAKEAQKNFKSDSPGFRCLDLPQKINIPLRKDR